ncbi:MAG TPA: lysine 2,3-aminomutase [Herpetosiphonaceae bacterium]|nr:lysine 2,3-aminomutase [Herpetosiphonaceae bacterium]
MVSRLINAPPRLSQPPDAWARVTPEQWNDWKWQLTHRLNTVEDFARVLTLTADEIAGLQAPDHFRVDVTPYFASLMDPDDPDCPIRRQVMPTGRELIAFTGEMRDSLAEDKHSPVPGLVHRYPDRVLMLVTTQCASYCRFCTRSRIVGDNHATFSLRDYERQLDYIAATPQIRDVLLSGGDPLLLPRKILARILERLRAIEHVEIVRLGTRVPLFLPQLITEDFAAMLGQFHPLWMNIHFNHPKELTPEICAALNRLADAGIPLGAQTVLMAGINDCPNIMLDLVRKLVRQRVRPYYLYQCDLVPGAGHFRTPVSKGLEIMESLRGHTSGYAIPTYVIDSPEGGGKIPLLPNYLISASDSRVVVRNYEGFISAYAQPENYAPHNRAACRHCQEQERPVGGVAGLLAGEHSSIAPEGWHAQHEQR